MGNKPKYICQKCGHIELPRKSIKKTALEVLRIFGLAFVVFTSLLGSTAIYNFVLVGVYDNPDAVFSIGGMWGTVNNFRSSFMTQTEQVIYSDYASPYIQSCENDECRARNIYDHLVSDYEYEEGWDLVPINIMKEKVGDCDEMSYLYVTLLRSIDIHAVMQCNEVHCWTIVHLEDKKILADITKGIWSEL